MTTRTKNKLRHLKLTGSVLKYKIKNNYLKRGAISTSFVFILAIILAPKLVHLLANSVYR